MSKPIVHARTSAEKYGGVPEDYLAIHERMDLSKTTFAKVTHRALFHHTLGPLIMEQMFGVTITNADGVEVCVRDLAEQHIMDDLGFIPTVEKWLEPLECQPWMAGLRTRPLRIMGLEGEEVAFRKPPPDRTDVRPQGRPPTDDPPGSLAQQLADRR